MRVALERGTAQVLARLETCLAEGIAAGELVNCADPGEVAQQLYQQWLGATLLARVQRSAEPLDRALVQTRRWIAGQASGGSRPLSPGKA